MEGLLAITGIKKYEPYFGFNRGIIELWKDVDVWNENAANSGIVLNDEFCDVKNIEVVENYFSHTKEEEKTNEYFYLIFINENLEQESPNSKFIFIGYDCGYLCDDGFPVLFSCIPNELQRPGAVNEAVKSFPSKLNSYGLFENIEDVTAYSNLRSNAIAEGKINGIETAFDNFSIVAIFLYEN